MNRIDLGAGEAAHYFRHPHFRDMGLLRARFRRHRYDLHTHPGYVIALITGGCERVRIGRRRETAPRAAVIVVNPEEPHDGEAGCAAGWAYRTFYPSVALMEEVGRERGHAAMPLFRDGVLTDPVLARSLARAHRIAETGDPEEAETAMLAALGHLIVGHADGARVRSASGPSGAVHRVGVYREMMAADLAGCFSLASLARQTGVTRFQVIRDFKQVMGLTPTAYLRDRRLHEAARLIRSGTPLADAALLAGFADQSHLSRAFKGAHGFSPGMMRRVFGGSAAT